MNCALSDVLLPLFGLSSVVPKAYNEYQGEWPIRERLIISILACVQL